MCTNGFSFMYTIACSYRIWDSETKRKIGAQRAADEAQLKKIQDCSVVLQML